MSNFYPLEVLGRGSDTKLQVGKNSNKITWRARVYRSILIKMGAPGLKHPLPDRPP